MGADYGAACRCSSGCEEMIVRSSVLAFRPVASVAAKLALYGALMFALLLTFAAIDAFVFGDGWYGPTREVAYVVSFALPAFVLAFFFQAWWVGFLAGLSILAAALAATLSTGDWETFSQLYSPRGILGQHLVSPFLSPIWGALAGSLLRRSVFGCL